MFPPQRSREEDGILRDDSDLRSQVMQTHGSDIDAVDQDATTRCFQDTEKRQGDGRLASSCPTHDSNFLLFPDVRRHVPDRQFQARPVSDSEILEDDFSSGRPRDWLTGKRAPFSLLW